jgi:hypothetical protein
MTGGDRAGGSPVASYINIEILYAHVRWVPRHHGAACPQVVDGGDALQVWRVAANILNKHSLTADKEWP